jgi:hypothetical protein
MSVAGPLMASSAPLSFLDFDPAPLLRRPSSSAHLSGSPSKSINSRKPISGGALKRSASYIHLPAVETPPADLYSLVLREPTRALSPAPRTQRVVGRNPAQEPLAATWTPSFPTRSATPQPAPSPSSSSTRPRTPRRNAPTTSRYLPPRERYPKAKHEPDLYRTALLRRMNGTPEGRAMLHMGVRLAVNMLEATRALEGLVADQSDADVDEDGAEADERLLATSWVDVPLDRASA